MYKSKNFDFILSNCYSFCLGICHLAQAIKGDVDDLVKGVGDKSSIEEVKHILEMVSRKNSGNFFLTLDLLR